MDWNLWNRGVGPVEEDAKSGAPSPVLGSRPDPPPAVLHLHHAPPWRLFGNPYLVRPHRSRRRWPVMDRGACVQSLWILSPRLPGWRFDLYRNVVVREGERIEE